MKSDDISINMFILFGTQYLMELSKVGLSCLTYNTCQKGIVIAGRNRNRTDDTTSNSVQVTRVRVCIRFSDFPSYCRILRCSFSCFHRVVLRGNNTFFPTKRQQDIVDFSLQNSVNMIYNGNIKSFKYIGIDKRQQRHNDWKNTRRKQVYAIYQRHSRDIYIPPQFSQKL